MGEENNFSFNIPLKKQANMIKVIGVGGGGGNAVNYMYGQQINGVDFVICNTDLQALAGSPITNRVQLGADPLGTGAGGNPEKGKQAANESIEEIQQALGGNTKMVFITAGMGGGTGTGAAPIIAGIAKEMGLLVVGIVTSPFSIEGKRRLDRAKKGIEELRKNVDSLIVINNDKLIEVYGNLGITSGYAKADEVLSIASKGIAEVITNYYKQNIDFQDAKTVLQNSGTAIMGASKESGEDRARKAIVNALDSPLLNDNKINGAKNVLLLIVSGKNEITFDEVNEITNYIQDEAGHDAEIFLGYGTDETLEDGISLTVVATGFPSCQQEEIIKPEGGKIIHTLEDEQKVNYSFDKKEVVKTTESELPIIEKKENPTIQNLGNEDIVGEQLGQASTAEDINNIDVVYHEIEAGVEDDFIITKVVREEEPKQEVEEQPPVVQPSLFDLSLVPINVEKQREPQEEVEANNEAKIQEEEPQKIEKRYVLDIEELETEEVSRVELKQTPKVKDEKVKIDEALDFKIKISNTDEVHDIEQKKEERSKEISPLNYSIAELKKRSQERRDTMKRFNHKFSSSLSSNINELESLPAYKRQGIDVDVTANISKQETSLKKGSDEFNLSSNSFLHDNVD